MKGDSWDPWATWNGSSFSWDRTWSQMSNWGAWKWTSEDDDSGGSAGKYELRGKGGSGGSETDSERSVQSRGFGTPEQVKKTMAEVHGRLESGGEHEQHDQRRGGRKGKDPPCPTWDGKDLS
eukprot:7995735-Pyramimonas_sp.AAC.1